MLAKKRGRVMQISVEEIGGGRKKGVGGDRGGGGRDS